MKCDINNYRDILFDIPHMMLVAGYGSSHISKSLKIEEKLFPDLVNHLDNDREDRKYISEPFYRIDIEFNGIKIRRDNFIGDTPEITEKIKNDVCRDVFRCLMEYCIMGSLLGKKIVYT